MEGLVVLGLGLEEGRGEVGQEERHGPSMGSWFLILDSVSIIWKRFCGIGFDCKNWRRRREVSFLCTLLSFETEEERERKVGDF